MIVGHNGVKNVCIEDVLNKALNINPVNGYLDMDVLTMFYKIFSWLYRGYDVKHSFIDTAKDEIAIIQLLDSVGMHSYINGPISETTVIFYKRMSKIISIRDFKKCKLSFTSKNKRLLKEDFKINSLYEEYAQCEADIPKNFLLVDFMFKDVEREEKQRIKKFSDVYKVANIVDLVKPDFDIKIARKNLKVRTDNIVKSTKEVVYVFQDCTYSMKRNTDKLRAIKAFILDAALRKNYTINWIEAGEFIVTDTLYSSIDDVKEFNFNFKYSSINYKEIFKEKVYHNKKIIVITDGTDDFNFNFSGVTQQISLVTFKENYKLKNKLSEYGKYYIF